MKMMSKSQSLINTDSNLTGASERSLIDSFDEFYASFESYIRKTLFWMVGKNPHLDLMQDVFEKIWKNRHQFRGDSQLKTWVHKITVNVALDYLKKSSTRNEFAVEQVPDSIHLDDISQSCEIKQIIMQAIQSLNPELRAAFVLYYQQDMSIHEISLILELPETTVKSRLHHAREEFKYFVNKMGVSYE